MGNQSTVKPAKRGRGLRILRGQSYKIIKKEIVLRSLTGFARKIDLKIPLTGAP